MNIATVGDDTAQSNFVGTSQDLQAVNVCDETGLGNNVAQCINSSENFIGPVGQTNDADGAGDADFTQNNNIPTINQVLVVENDCDQSDEQSVDGSNEAICGNSVQNFINNIAQTNDAEGTHVDDIFQDNTGSFSQVMTLNNGCDATTFSSGGDNSVHCDNIAQNFIGPVDQLNSAVGGDDVLIDQDNNVAVSQELTANNDCDATASSATSCFNSAQNFIGEITQFNGAVGNDFADISQSNDAVIDQNIDLLNSCDESGDGIHDASCSNSAQNFIGPVSQSNDATGAEISDAAVQSNGAGITQNLKEVNDCGEENTGDNLAGCSNLSPQNFIKLYNANKRRCCR